MKFPFRLPLVADGTAYCEKIIGSGGDIPAEKKLLSEPQKLINIQNQALKNRSDIILTLTAGATHQRLDELYSDEEFAEINRSLTELTVRTAAEKALTGAAAVSESQKMPTCANFEDIYFDYLEKFTIFKNAGADFIMLKNQDNFWDMRAGVLAAKTADIPIFVIMKVNDEGISQSGADYIAALITMQSLGAESFGIEYEGEPETLCELIERAFPHAEIPLTAETDFSAYSNEQLKRLSESGASIYINQKGSLTAEKAEYIKTTGSIFKEDNPKDSYAAAVDCAVFFLSDNLVFSEPLVCGYDLSEDLIDLDDENINAVYVRLNSSDDAAILADNAGMTRLPVMIHTNDPVTAEAALRYFPGRLITDLRCSIEPEILSSLAEKYGALLY